MTLKKSFLLFLFFFLIDNCYCQDICYYTQSGNKIHLIEDATTQYICMSDSAERIKDFLQELESVAEISHLFNHIYCCQIISQDTDALNVVCEKYSGDIAYKSAQLKFSNDSSVVWATDEIFVETKKGESIADVLEKHGILYKDVSNISKETNEYIVKLILGLNNNALTIANDLFLTGDVIYSHPSFFHKGYVHNALFSYQWALNNDGQYCDTTGIDINVGNAWGITKGDTSIVVALIDAGIHSDHNDLHNNVLQGYNMVTQIPSGEESISNMHGTPCAGIIAAEDNSIGVVGVAPKCKLLPLVVMEQMGFVNDAASVRAFRYLVDSSDAPIASCSWGGGDNIPSLTNAINQYIKHGRNGKGGVLVVSVGNNGVDGITYPANSSKEIITVGAICPMGSRKHFNTCDGENDWGSNYGNGLCVMAPGVKIATTIGSQGSSYYQYIGDYYIADFNGTSAACPHVAGVAALVLSINPNLSGRKVKEIIERSCTKVRQDIYSYDSLAPHGAWDYEMGYGLVNAYQAVLMAQGCKDYPYCTIDTIRGNASWNSPITVGDTLVIDSLSTLTISDTVAFYSEGLIIVRPGGKLIVNGGTLTSACEGEMWEGIIVEGNANLPQYAQLQGSVILNNATIENAHNAISTRSADSNALYSHTGGIIQATNTLFRNNRRAAEFLEYENHSGSNVTDNTSRFTRCTFTVDDDNLFASNGTSFLEHVSLWKVRGVKFNGCTFQNQDTTHAYANRGRALYTADAGYRCRRICPVVSDTDPCACQPSGSQPVVRCSFTGFYKAIESTGDCGQGSIVIDNCDFANNFVGIVLNASDNAQVSYNHFNLDFSQERNSGLRLVGSTGFTVEDNDFVRMFTTQDTIYGIICDNTGNAENFIRRNDFSNLFYGCYSLKNNGPIANRPRGLQFNCNSYTANTYDIYVPANSTIRNVQGSSNKGADNDFSNTLTRSLTIPMTMNTLSYYYSSGNSHIPVGTSNYTGYGTATANPCASTLCGLQNPSFTPGIIRYASLSEEYELLNDEFERRSYVEVLSDRENHPESEVQDAMAAESRLDALSVEMAELSNRGIKAVIQDSVMDFSQLKDWFGAVNTLSAKYLLIETYYKTGDYGAANQLLSALPDMFDMSEGEQEEYENYRAFHALRNTLAGDPVLSGGASVRRNWAELSELELAELQRIAESTSGRTATMAQGILCFFYHICYEDDMALNLGDIGKRSLGGDAQDRRTRCVPTDNGLAIYPNPADGTLTVESASPIREITVYDLSGRVMMTAGGGIVETCHGASLQMDVSSLQGGIYLLRVVTEKGVETGRFVKN